MGVLKETIQKQVNKQNLQYMQSTTGTILRYDRTTNRADIIYNNPVGDGTIYRGGIPVSNSLGGLTNNGVKCGQKCTITFVNGNINAPLITGTNESCYEDKTCTDQGAYLIDESIREQVEEASDITPMYQAWLDPGNKWSDKYKSTIVDYSEYDASESARRLQLDADKFSDTEIGLTNLETKSTLKIKDNGDIDIFVSDNVGIRISKKMRKIYLYGFDVNINGEIDLLEILRKCRDCKCGGIKEKETIIIEKPQIIEVPVEVPTPVEPINPYLLYGVVRNAVTNEIILVGCRLVFRDYGQNTGRIYSTAYTSDDDGFYQTSELPSNIKRYRVQISCEGFDTEYFDIQLPENETEVEKNFVLNPCLQDNEFLRVITTWEQIPRDIDTHIRPIGAVAVTDSDYGEDYINYHTKDYSFSNGAQLSLDVDNTQGFGPETVTLKENKDVSFIYYLVNFSKEADMTASNVCVRFKVAGGATRELTISRQDKSYLVWNVFKYENGVVTILDTYEHPYEIT